MQPQCIENFTNKKCPICDSPNTGLSKIININKNICYYCFTFFNKKIDAPNVINYGPEIFNILKENINYKNHKTLTINSFDFDGFIFSGDTDDQKINFYSKTLELDLNRCFKYGKSDILIIPNLNLINITKALNICKKNLKDKCKIYVGFYLIQQSQNRPINNNIINQSPLLNNIFAINLIFSQNNIGIKSIEYFDNYCLVEGKFSDVDCPEVIKKNQSTFDQHFQSLIKKAI